MLFDMFYGSHGRVPVLTQLNHVAATSIGGHQTPERKAVQLMPFLIGPVGIRQVGGI